MSTASNRLAGADQDAFVRAIAADPLNHLTRCVYADWLEEHGEVKAAANERQWVPAFERIRPLAEAEYPGLTGSAREVIDNIEWQHDDLPPMPQEVKIVLGVCYYWATAYNSARQVYLTKWQGLTDEEDAQAFRDLKVLFPGFSGSDRPYHGRLFR